MITKLIVDGVDCELTKELPVSTNYAIADIRDPDKRKGSGTKTIILPGTQKINNLFEHIWRINLELGTFNPNLAIEAVYYIDEHEQIKGDLELVKVNIQPQGYVEYECIIMGREGGFFATIGEQLLTDLDFSAFDHTYSKTEQKNTWATSYRLSGVATAFSYGSGYVYPLINYGYSSSDSVFNVNFMKPAIFAKEYVDAIFAAAGYTYTSSFFTSSLFKRLIIPCNREKMVISNASVAASQYYVGTTNETVALVGTTTGNLATVPNAFSQQTVPLSNEGGSYFDTSGQHNNTAGTVAGVPAYCSAIAYSGVYALVGKINIDIKADALAAYPLGSFDYTGTVAIEIQIGISTDGGTTWSYPVLQQGVGTIPVTPFNTYVTMVGTLTGQSANIYLSAGTLVRVIYYIKINNLNLYQDAAGTVPAAGGTAFTNTIRFATSSGSVLNEHYIIRTDTTVADGNTLPMNNTIPQNIKQKDFMKGLMQMFNLMFELDKTNDTNIIIEPRDTFFTNTSENWTKKVDYSKKIEVSPMGELDFKTLVCKYKSDKDYYNDLYDKAYIDNYGLKREVVNNDFIKNEKKIEVCFSPTPLVGNTSNNIIYPKIYANDGGNVKPISHNIRILYYGGVLSSGNSWQYQSGVSGNSTETTYPYAGHLDNPITPTIDLNFYYMKEVYYNFLAAYMTANNLYNNYYYRMISEATDPNSKIVKLYVRLTAKDIKKFTFRNPVYIWDKSGGAYYIVNKIIDYDPLVEKSTQVELLKLKTFSAYDTSAKVMIDRGLDTGVYEDVGINYNTEANFNSNKTAGNNLGLGNRVFVSGEGNSAVGCEDCFISEEATNISLTSCTRVSVAPDVTNFVGINLTDMIIDSSYSNKTINNSTGVIENTELRTETKTGTFTVTLDVDLYYVDCSGGNITANYDTTVYDYTNRKIVFKRIDSSANTFTIDDGSGLAPFSVDGNASPWATGMVQYDVLPITYDGTNFNIL